MRRAPLYLIGEPELISSGLTPDRHAIMHPLWEAAANVRFYQGKVRRLLPAAKAFDAAVGSVNRGIHQQQNSNGVRWIFSGTVDPALPDTMVLHRWFGPAAEQIGTIAGGVLDDTSQQKATQADFQAWGNWTLINTSTGPIQRYDPAGPALDDLPNAPADVIAIFKKQNQLMAVGHGLGKRQVSWSDADDIEDWTAAADNLAGSLTIEELKTPIRGAARLGSHIACYTEDQMALVYWIGAPFYFGQRVALDGIGCTGKKAVCTDGRLNYGMSRNGAWQTDGNEFRYIDQGIISDYLQENVNWDQGGKIVVDRNDVTRCIEFHFPTGVATENNEAWSYDPAVGSWSPIPAYQAMNERVLLDKPLVGSSGSVYLLDDDPAASGALLLRTKPLLISKEGQPGLHLDARIDEVELATTVARHVQFRLLNATDIDGQWEQSNWEDIQPDMQTYRISHLPSGTYHKLEFRSIATDWDLNLQGIALFGEVEGVKRDRI